MAINPETTVRKLVSLPKTMVQEIDDFRFQERIKTEAEAIRQLIALGLAAVRLRDKGYMPQQNDGQPLNRQE
ncbi:hypothetical protein [Pseudochelatococcus contaminans]|uniref:Metal-responsive CopG/Arc/MetJ family transcriptional regulator n=1 Tax=Pseudochelatococcus contaminans TaxID=1538103 RepID=A0A7W5Z283_9HYPH|nr:hypothetical protein [Pseudochelatococcus contaminans]MBB3808765.1 metal-responsive CopG/Arc/MetJ family transcriptional regulator [Pseudochelatococcus contaminans]